ncbi:alpha-2-macroglobulin [Tenacibaculum sp. M341]|nr:alpha-2-macroglobulin [Tenacibaculum sp. M341]
MLVLFSTSIKAQNNYESLWEKVSQFEKEDLPKSALKVVEEIYGKAIKENNSPQLIKTLLFKSKFALIIEEDAQLKVINEFKKHIQTNNTPTKNVLENILANLYWQYFNQHRWKFYNRTKTNSKVDETDFRTWDLETLFTEIHTHYQNSLTDKETLQKTDIHKFSDILNTVKGSKKYRPTLYDFLAHNALTFYKTDETSITKPNYQFKIDNSDLLCDAVFFSKLNIQTKDTLSLQFNALKIHQELIDFHYEKGNTEALVNVDLERLDFVHKNATFKDKQAVFLETLKTSENNYTKQAVSGLYTFKIAKVYHSQARKYSNETNKQYRFKNKEALELCEKVIKQFPESRAAKECKVLTEKIKEKQIKITSEKYIPIDSYSRLLINFNNIKTLYFSVYQIDQQQKTSFKNLYKLKEKKAFIQKLKKVNNWNSTLPNEFDYLNHSTEVILPKLSQGQYLIVTANNESLSDNTIYGTCFIQVTNLSLITRNEDGKSIYQLLDRVTGTPLTGANVRFSNKSNRRYRKSINKTFTTDKNGEFSYNPNTYYDNVKAFVNYKNDNASFGNYYLRKQDDYNERPNKQIRTFLFTDRSIYRPGQTVYFKGISMEAFKKETKVISNKKATVILRDVNYQEVKKLELTTNEYGSFSGEFIIPNSGLTGNFTIEVSVKDRKGQQSISVEEYKRPKFETTFKPVTETYRVNDEIKVNGNAKAFAGSAITDGKVVYRVHRKIQYPSWCYWYRPYLNSSPQEIINGETTTNNKGDFEITFKALRDESANKENLPVFTYEVTADVTDINGETRSATSLVKVGYHSLLATVAVSENINKAIKKQIVTIDTQNLNGEFTAASGEVSIYKLVAPKKPLRKRPWAAPYYQTISEDEFNEKFPNEAYKNEDNPLQWKKGEKVFSSDFNTNTSKEIELPNLKKWTSGKYIIELTSQDKFNQKVTDKKYFSLFSEKDKLPADNKLFTVTTNKDTYNVNDTAEITFSSNSEAITMMVFVEKKHKLIASHYIQLNKNSKTIKVPVTSEDVGGFGIRYHFVNYNDFENGSLVINVPYPSTDLEITTNTFRDKLQPGANETWSFTVKGSQKDKVTAELLAGMYDTSLDQFKKHQWRFNPIQKPSYNLYNNTNAYISFTDARFHFNSTSQNRAVPLLSLGYDELNWFGFDFYNQQWAQKSYVRNLIVQKTNFGGVISGIIEDESGPLPGATVIIKGTVFGTETDFNGRFSLKVNKGDVVVFSFVGYKTVEKTVGDFSNILITLEEANTLDEVVVAGYATKRKRAYTGSATNKIHSKLEGRAADVMVESEDDASNLTYAAPGSPENIQIRGAESVTTGEQPLYVVDGKIVDDISNINEKDILTLEVLKGAKAMAIYGSRAKDGVIIITTGTGLKAIPVRKNLQETAFFYPHLTTDANGNVSFSFTAPEALTRWSLQLLAHTKELHAAVKSFSTVTQKELMVIPNAPRFLREGDVITLSAKISNLSDRKLVGVCQLVLTDAVTSAPLSNLFSDDITKSFSVDKDGNTNVSWKLNVSDTAQAIQYKIIAKAGDFSDGEQSVLPVLSNRMLVTETLPMWVRSNQSKTFTLNKLKNNTSNTLKHHKLSLEVTSNPAWYAVQALPYLMEYPHECAEQTFARYYANTLASFIANSNPRIQNVFNQWKTSDALISNLEKNEELKSLIIQETPWLRDAQSESEQKKRIALLFDLNKMKNEQHKTIQKLKNMQMPEGGFPWFKGGRYPSIHITNHIATGFGHLRKLGIEKFDKTTEVMLPKTVRFLDEEFEDTYKRLLKQAEKIRKQKGKKEADAFLQKKQIGYTQIQYLYMRSFFKDITMNDRVQKAVTYYTKQAEMFWNDFNLYAKGQIALTSFRNTNTTIANKILKSLEENSITSEELGMYWKENKSGWYWHQAPIETQALLIEAFSEVSKDTKTIDNLKIWLLKNKQVSRWKTTKATSDAVYALLLQGTNWISSTEIVTVKIGDTTLDPKKIENTKVEAGTGYFKTSWSGNNIKPSMANVTLTKKDEGIAWGGLYWQYFEDLDKITSAKTPLQLTKQLFKKVNADTGKKLIAVSNENLAVGDLVTVRIELRADRTMEFIHMKDMRASAFEPVDVLSKYKWQDGLGYYQSTKDAATHFFFNRLAKGTYVFEYDVRVNNKGSFSNGITSIQSMYAPEFSSHSEGVRVIVK